MIRFAALLVVAAAALLAGCATPALRAVDAGGERLLVTIHYDVVDSLHGNIGDRYRRPGGYGAGPSADPLLDALATQYSLVRVTGWPMRTLGVHCEVFAVPDGVSVDDLAAKLAHDPRVDSAEPMHRFVTLGSDTEAYRPLQHALDALEVDAAHELSRGAGVRVAVVDSGIDGSHRDLLGSVTVRRNFTAGATAAHGTEVAGLIAARGDGGAGIFGVAPAAELVDLRACHGGSDPRGPAVCDTYTLAQALDYAVAERFDVINLSLSGPVDALLERLLAAAESRGICVVAAAVPGKSANSGFPASSPSVIAVASADAPGPWPDKAVRAPGVDVLTTFPGNRYDYASGSSLASAHVSGVVALLRSLDRNMAPSQVRALLGAHRPLSAAAVLRDAAARIASR